MGIDQKKSKTLAFYKKCNHSSGVIQEWKQETNIWVKIFLVFVILKFVSMFKRKRTPTVFETKHTLSKDQLTEVLKKGNKEYKTYNWNTNDTIFFIAFICLCVHIARFLLLLLSCKPFSSLCQWKVASVFAYIATLLR